MDSEKFSTFFDNDKRLVKEHEFRKSIFKGNYLRAITSNKLKTRRKAINFKMFKTIRSIRTFKLNQ